MDVISKIIGLGVILVRAFVFIFIVFLDKDYSQLPIIEKLVQSFVAAVALAVAAIPEGLPAVIVLTLVAGSKVMWKKNALIRKLSVTESIGSIDVICTDKTGTLTKNEMSVTKLLIDDKVIKTDKLEAKDANKL